MRCILPFLLLLFVVGWFPMADMAQARDGPVVSAAAFTVDNYQLNDHTPASIDLEFTGTVSIGENCLAAFVPSFLKPADTLLHRNAFRLTSSGWQVLPTNMASYLIRQSAGCLVPTWSPLRL